MDDYSEGYQETSDENEFPSKLQITVDKDGSIEYNCDWDSQDGAIYLGSIFYKIIYDDLITSILEDIHSRCKENDVEEDYYLMIDVINKMAEIQLEEDEGEDQDPIVIPADKISNIL